MMKRGWTLALGIAVVACSSGNTAGDTSSGSGDGASPTEGTADAGGSPGASLGTVSPSVTDASVAAPDGAVDTPPPAAAFSISSPVNGASVSGVIPIHGVAGSQWVNVAVFNASTYAKVATDATPANGAFTLSLDTTQFANGSVQLNVQAFSVPAGQKGGTSSEVQLQLAVNNQAASATDGGGGGSVDAQPGGSGDAGSGIMPFGNIPGTWTLAFDDEFNGTSLDTTKWDTGNGGNTNDVTTYTSNVAVSGGNLVLTLASSTSGAIVCSGASCNFTGSGAYDLPVGGYAEARVYFPGSGTTIYNWPAWWLCGPNWPADGENDVAEGNGTLTENYHSPSGALNHMIAGTWSNAFHVYGLLRQASSASAYWDGQLVVSYPTDDNGGGQSLVLNVGNGYGTGVYGTGSQVLVDYVRAWQ